MPFYPMPFYPMPFLPESLPWRCLFLGTLNAILLWKAYPHRTVMKFSRCCVVYV